MTCANSGARICANGFPSPQTPHPGPCAHVHAGSNSRSVTPSDWAAFPTIAESESEPTCCSLGTAVFFSSLSLRTHLPPSDVWQPMKKTSRKSLAVVLAVSLFVGMISRAGAADYVG